MIESQTDGQEFVGQIIQDPSGRRARVLVCSLLLDLALVQFIDENDEPIPDKRGVARPSAWRTVQ